MRRCSSFCHDCTAKENAAEQTLLQKIGERLFNFVARAAITFCVAAIVLFLLRPLKPNLTIWQTSGALFSIWLVGCYYETMEAVDE